MPLLLKSGAVFLHIPKTGGSWITKVLTEQKLVRANFGHKHATFDRVLFRENFEKSYKLIPSMLGRWFMKNFGRDRRRNEYMFCFVRHPLKWLESFWRFCKGLDWNAWGEVRSRTLWHPNAILNGLGHDEFSPFVGNVIRRRPGYVSELFASYTQAGIDFIGRQENLVDDLICVLKHLNENFDEDFVRTYREVNASHTPKEAVHWTPEIRRAALQTELPALLHYGYLTAEDRQLLHVAEAACFAPSPVLSPIPLSERNGSTSISRAA